MRADQRALAATAAAIAEVLEGLAEHARHVAEANEDGWTAQQDRPSDSTSAAPVSCIAPCITVGRSSRACALSARNSSRLVAAARWMVPRTQPAS